MGEDGLRMWGRAGRLLVDIDGEEHDISHLVELTKVGPGRLAWVVEPDAVQREIVVERRARARAEAK